MDIKAIFTAVVLFGFSVGASAQNDPGMPPDGKGGGGMHQDGPGGEQHHRPPKEAVEACKGKADNAACSFTGRNGENLTGTCGAPPSSEGNHPLACRPAGNEKRGGQGMKPQRQEGQEGSQSQGNPY